MVSGASRRTTLEDVPHARSNARWLSLVIGVGGRGGATAPPRASTSARDWYFGEALYYAQQGHFFEALERLDAELGQHRGVDEPALDSLYHSLREAEFSVGDFELNYRMHHRAGRAITAVLEGAVDEAVRNDAAYRLARIHFQKGPARGRAARARPHRRAKCPEDIADDIEFLRANTYTGLGRHAEAAEVLKRLQSAEGLKGLLRITSASRCSRTTADEDALEQLDRAGPDRERR